ncbi:sensor domain-containing diguanylate cyclase [Nocardia stercoris]|uniref:sensor domain-containing diguanylate cyclase n=1 Tax=Nocardia stercoris TaxID=2483361 RepID=UPI00131A1E07|nr:sensor domain-containing diguanylate cyclase [Nocardia stercoris]
MPDITAHETSDVVARRWRSALTETGFVPMTVAEFDTLLAHLLATLVNAVHSEPFAPLPAAAVGAELVRLNLTDPRALTVTARALTEAAGSGPRLPEVVAELARGYTEALLRVSTRRTEMLQAAMAEAREAAEKRFRIVFDNAAFGIAIGDTRGRLVDANPTLVAMLGKPLAAIQGSLISGLVYHEDRAGAVARIDELLATGAGTVRMQTRYRRADLRLGWAEWVATLAPATGGHGAYLLAIGEDITLRRAQQDELQHEARHDPLTGLPNRRQLVDVLTGLIAASDPTDRIGVGFIDLDGFKTVNDTFGHSVGDRLLAAAADRLSTHSGDAMLARLGGDEFVILFSPPTDAAQISRVVEALLAALVDPVRIDEHLLTISACIGAVVSTAVGTTPEELLEAADSGLYRAKAAGRNRWVLHSVDTTAGAGHAGGPA